MIFPRDELNIAAKTAGRIRHRRRASFVKRTEIGLNERSRTQGTERRIAANHFGHAALDCSRDFWFVLGNAQFHVPAATL